MKSISSLFRQALHEKQRYSKTQGAKYSDFVRFEQAYKPNANLFAHYSDIEKLGINPQYDYDTPMGIYGWPCTHFSLEDLRTGNTPFASERKYLTLFELKQANNIASISRDGQLQGGHINAQYIEQKLKEYEQHPQYNTAVKEARINSPFGHYFAVTWHTANKKALAWTKLMMRDGLDGIIDNGSGIITHWERYQAVFFKAAILQRLVTVNNPAKDGRTQLTTHLLALYELRDLAHTIDSSFNFSSSQLAEHPVLQQAQAQIKAYIAAHENDDEDAAEHDISSIVSDYSAFVKAFKQAIPKQKQNTEFARKALSATRFKR